MPARKPKRVSLDQGSAREILDVFIAPLLKNCPDRLTQGEWLAFLFHVEHREVVRHVATKNFRLPGLFMAAPLVGVQGLGYRKVKRKDALWVRFDAKAPDQIEVEYFGGQGQADQVFRLTRSEWNSIAMHLKIAERPPKKLPTRKR